MRLVHHVIPLAVQQLVVIRVAQCRVFLEHRPHFVGFNVRPRISNLRIRRISRRRNIHLRQIRARIHWVLNQLKVRSPLIFRQSSGQLVHAIGQRAPFHVHAVGLVIVRQTECRRIDQLRFPPSVVPGVILHRRGDLIGMLRPKFPHGPKLCKFVEVVFVPALRRSRIIKKKLNRKLHRFSIAHIHHPEPVRSIRQRQIHLLLDLRQIIRVQPLVRSRTAHIVEVVVDSRSARALALLRRRQPPQISPVVVAPQQGHIVRHAHAFFVVALHLFVKRPYLWNLLEVRIHRLLQDLSLVRDDSFQQFRIRAGRHRRVAFAAHPQRHYFFVVFVALHSSAPELVNLFLIRRVIPRTMMSRRPLFFSAHHRLFVRGAHYDAVFIGQLRVQWIVRCERVVPHGRPQKIRLQPQE